jgi:hypothetical protein
VAATDSSFAANESAKPIAGIDCKEFVKTAEKAAAAIVFRISDSAVV